MISLVLSSAKPRSSEPTAPAGAANGENGTFSIVLAALNGKPADGDGEVATTSSLTTNTQESLLEAIEAGMTLPVPAETGKVLPDIAAAALEGSHAKTGEPVDDADELGAKGVYDATEVEDAAPVAVPLLLPTLAAAATDTATAAEAKSAPPLAASSAYVAEEAPLPSSTSPAPVKRESGQDSNTPSVALHVASEADTVSPDRGPAKGLAELQPLKAREALVDGSIPKAASADPAPQAPSAPFAQVLQAESPHASRPTDISRPAFQPDALQDLTRIVDRLAAAREVFAPATAALAVKHVEFGELSLRFDQQRDGQLAVQLSASDPDAHRAVIAAVGERGSATLADSHTGTGHSQAQARGAAAERDSSGSASHGNAARQDRPQQGRSTPAGGQPRSDTPRSGIFA